VVAPPDLPVLRQVLGDIPHGVPVTIQPEYYSYGADAEAKFFEWVRDNLRDRRDVRVLPQLHRLIWPRVDKGV
jgi:hypothetical protein